MIILLCFIMVVSISCSLFYGAASFAHLNLYEDHKNDFEKGGLGSQKTHKLLMRYNLLCYRHSVKRFVVSLLINIISLITGYSIL